MERRNYLPDSQSPSRSNESKEEERTEALAAEGSCLSAAKNITSTHKSPSVGWWQLHAHAPRTNATALRSHHLHASQLPVIAREQGRYISCAETVWVHVCIYGGIAGEARAERRERLVNKILQSDPVNEHKGQTRVREIQRRR